MNIYLTLFIEFFKIGLFAVGGGLATVPFLYDLADKYDWITPEMISDMIAVAESTPGPIGINTATYVGFNAGGVPGSIIASLSLVLPSFIIILMISRVITKFQTNPYVISVFSTLRPAVTALILAAGLQVLDMVIFTSGFQGFGVNLVAALNIKTSLLFLALLGISMKKSFHPIIIIATAAAAGVIFKM
ncbi:MAG: chromate transporter [Bacillota bacterium]|nr:chromate transporter [Bacillota bacterium]